MSYLDTTPLAVLAMYEYETFEDFLRAGILEVAENRLLPTVFEYWPTGQGCQEDVSLF